MGFFPNNLVSSAAILFLLSMVLSGFYFTATIYRIALLITDLSIECLIINGSVFTTIFWHGINHHSVVSCCQRRRLERLGILLHAELCMFWYTTASGSDGLPATCTVTDHHTMRWLWKWINVILPGLFHHQKRAFSVYLYPLSNG